MYGNRHSWVAAEAPKMWQQQASQGDPQIDSECERGNDSRTIAKCLSEFSGEAFAGGWPRGNPVEWSRAKQMVAVVRLDISVCYGSACICISLGLCICICVCLCARVLASSCRFVSSNYRWSRLFFRHLSSCYCCSCSCCCCGCWHVFPRSTHRIQFAWFYFRFSSLAVLPSFLLSLPGGTCSLSVRNFLFSLSFGSSCFWTWFWFWFWFLAIPALATATWVCNLIWFSAVSAAFCQVLLACPLDGQLRSRLPLKLTLPNLPTAAIAATTVTRNCHFV